MPIVSAILSFLGGWLARLIGSAVVRFIALKVILYALCVTILPIVLYNLFNKIMGEILTVASSGAGGYELQPFVVQLTGFMGWLAIKLKIPETFSIIISSAIFRMAISFIPFIGRA